MDSITELPELHYFNGKENNSVQDTCTLASYTRCGNTLSRAWLERITGIITGSDANISKMMNVHLIEEGLAGEGVCDKRVWVCKTHYGDRCGTY